MSEPIPESIPTSQDPRSKRPTKKSRAALTPASAQAATLTALFAKPEQEIRMPSGPSASGSGSGSASGPAPPELVANVQGSSAGAGSGEFHVYKASRRREYERRRAMDAEVAREADARDFERRRREVGARDAERTRRNREKRDKARARKARGAPKADAAAGREEEEEEEEEEAAKGVEEGAGERKGPWVGGIAAEVAQDEAGGNGVGNVTKEAGLIIHDDD